MKLYNILNAVFQGTSSIALLVAAGLILFVLLVKCDYEGGKTIASSAARSVFEMTGQNQTGGNPKALGLSGAAVVAVTGILLCCLFCSNPVIFDNILGLLKGVKNVRESTIDAYQNIPKLKEDKRRN